MILGEQMKVSWDIDDVLISTAQHTIDIYNRDFGTQLTLDDWYQLEDLDLWGVTDDMVARVRVNEIVRLPEFLDTVPAMPGALPVIQSLSHVAEQLATTGRPDVTRVETGQTLDKHYPGYFSDASLHMTDHMRQTDRFRNKADVLLELGATHHVDDHDDHVVPIALAGLLSVRFGKYSWHKVRDIDLPDRVVLAGDMDAVGEFFQDDVRRIAEGKIFDATSKRQY